MRSLSPTLLCLLAGAVLTASSSLSPHGWSQGQEYRYSWTSQVLSGIPELNAQYSGLRLVGEIVAQANSDSVLIIRIEEPKMKVFNDVLDLDEDNMAIGTGSEDEAISREMSKWLETPFKVYQKGGLVEKLEFEKEEPEFIVNIKKGIMSKLQLDLSQSKNDESLSQNEIQRGQTSPPVFRTVEGSVIGECETVYTINKLPSYMAIELEQQEEVRDLGEDKEEEEDLVAEVDEEKERDSEEDDDESRKRKPLKDLKRQRKQQYKQEKKQRKQSQKSKPNKRSTTSEPCEGKDYFEVIKTKNLDSCIDRPVFTSSYGSWKKTDGPQSSSLPAHSSVTRTIICGSLVDYQIRKVTIENTVLASALGKFDSDEKLDVTSYSTLSLLSVKATSQALSAPTSSKAYSSLVFEYPSKNALSNSSLRQECRKQQGCQQADGSEAHAPLPDMESDPVIFSAQFASQSDLQAAIIKSFKKMVEATDNMQESAPLQKDVSGMSVEIAKAIEQLGLESLRELERQIESEFEGQRKEMILGAFYDLVSMAGSNPAVMLLKKKIESGEINEQTAKWSWIISNAIRNVNIPTEELIRELIHILKHENVQKSKVLKAAVAMGVTEIVHKACVHPQSSQNEFPANIFGSFCNEDSDVIKKELLPYLTQKLTESANTDVASVITWVNALGNLGTDEASLELLKVVEGKITINPHPRSVAIYKLIRAAQLNPTTYRPVFMALIENPAENTEVRMAAVTALSYCSPSTADLQRLAIRTWFEPYIQVSSFIYSTLKSLKNLPETDEDNSIIRLRAEQAFSLCKPSDSGIQYSKNWQLSHFEESLKASVDHKYQVISSEESAIPKLIYSKLQVKTMASTEESLEAAFYLQGAEFIIEKLYDLYADIAENSDEPKIRDILNQNQQELEDKMRKLNVEPRKPLTPEAYLTLKFMGLQKLYSLEAEQVNEIVRQISSIIAGSQANLRQGMEKEYLKVLDISGADYAFPTESGILAFISVRNPVVFHAKLDVKLTESRLSAVLDSQPQIEIQTRGAINHKSQIHAGIVTPLTGKLHMAGVEVALHLSSPFNAKLSYDNGHVAMKIEALDNEDIQKKGPVFQYSVMPFTSQQESNSLAPVAQDPETKIVKSRDSKKNKKELNLGAALGLALKISMESEQPVDLYQLLEDLKKDLPFMLSSLPLPVSSPKRTTVTVYLDAQSSETKEIEMFFNIGAAEKVDETLAPEILIGAFDKDAEIRRICSTYTDSEQEKAECIKEQNNKWQEQEVDPEIEQDCLQERKEFKDVRLRQEVSHKSLEQQKVIVLQKDKDQQRQQKQSQRSQQSVQDEDDLVSSEDIRGSSLELRKNQPSLNRDITSQRQNELREEREERFQKCKLERQVCEEEKKYCDRKTGRINQDNEDMCEKKKQQCLQRHINGQVLREPLHKIGEGKAVTVSAGIVLKSPTSQDRKIVTQVTLGEKLKKTGSEETQVNLRLNVESPELPKPFVMELRANGKVQRPIQRWSAEEMLEEDLTAEVQINGNYGYEEEDRSDIDANIVLYKSEEQKEQTRRSVETATCKKHVSEGRKLTAECQKTRHEASSLDKIHAKMSLPADLTRNNWTRLLFQGVKAYLLPYLNEKSVQRRPRDAAKDEFELDAYVTAGGELGTVIVAGNGKEVSVKNVRLGSFAKEILPVCAKHSFALHILQALTKDNALASCAVESGKINTFDNVEYDYDIGAEEHLVFGDCSARKRIMVTAARKTSSDQKIMMIVDNHKYEVEIKKPSRFARDSQVIIRVNGKEKRLQSSQEVDQDTKQILQNLQQARQQNINQQSNLRDVSQSQRSAQQINQQQLQDKLRQELQKNQKLKVIQGELNSYDDENTYVTQYEDGVYAIVSKKYGVSVYADGERMEVLTFKHLLKNKACGLCGDLNGEKTADLKSPGQCVMSKPMLGAYSYIIEGGQSIPSKYQDQLRQEQEDCLKKEDVPTKVSHIFRQMAEERSQPELRHLTEKRANKVCISMERVKTCAAASSPAEVDKRLVRFTCLLEQDAQVWVKRAEGGDQIYAELQGLPVHFTQIVYEPAQC